jgi:hypothetical protein
MKFSFILLFVCFAALAMGGCSQTIGNGYGRAHLSSDGGGGGYIGGPPSQWVQGCHGASYAICGRDGIAHRSDANQNN